MIFYWRLAMIIAVEYAVLGGWRRNFVKCVVFPHFRQACVVAYLTLEMRSDYAKCVVVGKSVYLAFQKALSFLWVSIWSYRWSDNQPSSLLYPPEKQCPFNPRRPQFSSGGFCSYHHVPLGQWPVYVWNQLKWRTNIQTTLPWKMA